MMKTLRKTSSGFTIIELMIAVAILAIVMGIAIPSYTQYVIESGRADAKSELFRVAQVLERCYTRYYSYDPGGSEAPDECDSNYDEASPEGKYQITVSAMTATTFELTATPLEGQAKDSECKSFTLTHTGVKGIDGGDGTAEDCW
jgi:type IV pilus assembly protein PilE